VRNDIKWRLSQNIDNEICPQGEGKLPNLTKWVKIQAEDRPGRRQMVHAPGEGRRMDGTIRYRITPQKEH
jgi:hypothetical protein